jgi:dipeptidyl aminopeptidase/acylaminoacyl peptidase
MVLRNVAAIALAAVAAQAQAPGSDIWVIELREAGGQLALGPARNVTSRMGYDNQPAWSRAGDAIYYSSQRDDAQNDIWRVDLVTGVHTRLTRTAPESEYSPTITPDGNALSVVKVERDSAQRLWRVPLDGGEATVLLAGIKPVGYHAWGDDTTLGLFVLGSPATFQVADTRSGNARVVASGIQRGIARIPGERAISFIRRVAADEAWIMRYDVATGDTSRIARTMAGVQDYAWTPGGTILAARGSQVFALRGTEWVSIGDLAAAGVRGATRLAVSPRGDRIAIVAEDRAP